MSFLRRRRGNEYLHLSNIPLSNEDERDPNAAMLLPNSTFISVMLILVSLYSIVYVVDNNLPDPLMESDAVTNPDRFIAEKAKLHVSHLSRLGPRPVGSLANEVLATQYLTKVLTAIQAQSRNFNIELDHQVVDGEFNLQFLDGLTSVYHGIQNIIVRVNSKQSSGSAILFNCHFDSVVDSPGASDDIAACAVLLEVLRIISLSNTTLHNDLVFLFNGAEENLLQGSHGFITKHKWAKNLLAVVNMDACGVGGREILFQAGPENPWLLEAYAIAVKNPTASIFAQEVFQSGLFPGDTDYRIFRDFGHIPGLDFAWATGGYMYHTKLDKADYVTLSSLQHTGDNILSLTHHLAKLKCPEECENSGTMVFFDVLHLYLFRISSNFAFYVNCLMIITTPCIVFWNASRMYVGQGRRKYIKSVLQMTSFIIGVLFLTLTIVLITAKCIYAVNRSLSWFTKPIWIFFLYGLLSIVIPFHLAWLSKDFFKILANKSKWELFNLFVDSNQVLLTIPILIGLLLNVKSVFLFTMLVAFHSIANLGKNVANHASAGRKWVYFYIIPHLFPCTMIWYISHVLYKVVIPIMGRAGTGALPEIIIASVTFLIASGFCYILFPMLFVCANNPTGIIKGIYSVIFSSLLILMFTPIGFPYSDNIDYPSPQRYTILHTRRIFYNAHRQRLLDDSGFWVVDLDPNSPNSVKNFVPEFSQAIPINNCSHQLYCGLPYKLPVSTMLSKTHWIPGPEPQIYTPSYLDLVEKTHENDIIKMKIHGDGPDQMRIMLSPIDGVILESWSLADNKILAGAKWGSRDTYFIYYSYATYRGPLTFWVKLKIIDPSVAKSDYFLDIAVSGHYLHGPEEKSLRLTKLLSRFPPWTVTSGWVATYTSYKF